MTRCVQQRGHHPDPAASSVRARTKLSLLQGWYSSEGLSIIALHWMAGNFRYAIDQVTRPPLKLGATLLTGLNARIPSIKKPFRGFSKYSAGSAA